MESRLRRRSVGQSKKQLYASLFGIVIVLFIAINFGPYLIGSAGTIIDKITGKTGQDAAVKSDAQIQPPTLDLIPAATPSANIRVTGRTDYPNGSVELYVNGSLSDTANVDNSQNFEFGSVSLSNGDNYIKARMVLNNQKSDFSNEQKISYTKSAPKLDISNPTDKQSFNKADQIIPVRGITDPDNNVTVNGFTAIVDNSGNFSYNLSLTQGDNKVTIIATNPAGQTTTKDLTVSYSP